MQMLWLHSHSSTHISNLGIRVSSCVEPFDCLRYHALLQLLRAKTPAELLRASSRLCSHVVSADSVAGGGRDDCQGTGKGGAVAAPLLPSAGGGWVNAPTPGSSARLAEVLRRECNEILLSNGNEVDLAELLASPGRVIQVVSAKRQKLNSCTFGAGKASGVGASSAAAWPCLSGASAASDDKGGAEGGDEGRVGKGGDEGGVGEGGGGGVHVSDALEGVEECKGGTDTTEEQESNDAAAPQAPALQPQRSHLKRPEGLALHELQVPIAMLPLSGGVAGGGDSTNVEEEDCDGECDIDVPLADLSNALSPLLASSLGVAPESMRSFLRLDDLTFDLLSPLGSTRPEGKVTTELDSFK